MAEDATKDKPQDQSPQDQTNTDKDQDNLPANDVQVEDVGTLRKKLTITIPRERIDAKYDEMFGELSSTAQIPGFRIEAGLDRTPILL